MVGIYLLIMLLTMLIKVLIIKALLNWILLQWLKGDEYPEYIFENDVIIYDYDDEVPSPDAVASVLRLWDKNGTEVTIPYTTPNGLSPHQENEINKAINEFESKTCIR